MGKKAHRSPIHEIKSAHLHNHTSGESAVFLSTCVRNYQVSVRPRTTLCRRSDSPKQSGPILNARNTIQGLG